MKIMTIKYQLTAILILLATASCTKVIDLKLGNNTGKLVIEGNITDTGSHQSIMLSQNVPFSNTNTYPPVSGAVVSVRDDKGNIYPFTEGAAGTYSTNMMKTTTGVSYTMTVLTNGETYSANSTMPALVQLDSITTQKKEFNNSKGQQNVLVHYKDPAGLGNQYRFVMYVNNIQVKWIFAFNDDFTDGRYVNNDLQEDDIDIYRGDTVTVEMQCIDKPIYTYWLTLMQQAGNGTEGSVAPSNPPTNITPAPLGYFSAHTTQIKTIIVK